MRKCTNPGCPCICDDPDMHHELARLGGSAEVDPSCCARAEPTVPASEHQRMQAEAAALLKEVEEWANPGQGMGSGLHAEKWPPLSRAARAEMKALLARCSAAGATLLEEVEGLRRANEAMSSRLAPDWSRWIGPCVHGRDPWDRCDTCEEAGEAQSIVWVLDKERKEHAAESAGLRARLERAEGAAKSSHAVVEQMRTERTRLEAYIERQKRATAAEVRRAVEEAVERCAVVASRTPCPKGHSATSTGYMAKLIAAAIRARGKKPEK